MIRSILVSAYLVTFATLALGQTRWRPEDGGNGHWYLQIVDGQRDWANAKVTAEALSFMGTSGHLVTITSPAEQLFVESVYDGGISWIGLTDDPAFGGTESFGQPNPLLDGWVWITGEPVTYSNWFAAGEPNNQGGNENFVTMGTGAKLGGWNDSVSSPTAGTLSRYIVEFVPEPSASLTAAMGLFGFIVARRRRR